jgi:dihydroorotate dehydrogenase (NAD+) catalytic subunit
MLNSIGLQNPGLEDFIGEKWDFLAGLDAQIVVNIAGFAVEEFALMAERLEALAGIAALEVNISCPNVEEGGDSFANRPETAAAVIAAVRARTRRPLIAKLSPNVTDITAIASAVVEAGADAVSLINTLIGMAIDIDRRKPVLGNTTGGLSGPAIKPVALAMVWKVAQAVAVPVMGIGGISSAQDALEFIVAGASAVQVGTASFANPNAGVEVVEGIRAHCQQRGIERVGALVGTLQT